MVSNNYGDIEKVKKDIDRVGLSENSRFALDQLMADGHFKDMLSAYRLATALALTKKIDISEHHVDRHSGHMYLISQVDPDGVLARVIKELFPNLNDQEYRSLEKFADLGAKALLEHVNQHGTLVFWE